MALGLLFGISWICFLLLNGSAGLPAIKGYGYPHVADSRNMRDDGDGDVSDVHSDNSERQPSSSPASSVMMTSYQHPWFLRPALNLGTVPEAPNAPEMVRPVLGGPSEGGPYQSSQPLIFPLRPNKQSIKPTGPLQNPVQTQSSGISEGTGEPAWEAHASPAAHLVFEDVFQYPEEQAGSVSDPSASTAMTELSPDDVELGQTSYQPQVEKAAHETQVADIPQSVSEPFSSSYIVQSRSGYRRAMHFQKGLKYTPEIPPPMVFSAMDVGKPAPQPATPVNVKKPAPRPAAPVIAKKPAPRPAAPVSAKKPAPRPAAPVSAKKPAPRPAAPVSAKRLQSRKW